MEQDNQPPTIPADEPPRRSWRWPAVVIVVLLVLVAVALVGRRPPQLHYYPADQLPPDVNVSSLNDPNGPYSHQVYRATSSDGQQWTTDDTLLFDHASVPGAVRQNSTIYLYYVDASHDQDQLSVAISTDNGQSFGAAEQVQIEGVKPYDAVDPSPEIVDGILRLYYLGDFMSNKGPQQKFKIYSAQSSDGIHFTDPVLAYSFDETTTDPDVFPVTGGWRMFVSQGRAMQLLTSTDGLTFAPDSSFSWNRGAVSDTAVFGSTYRTYYCGEGIQSATGADTGILQPEAGVRIQAKEKITCDPSVVPLADGTYLIFYKTQAAPSMAQPGGQPSQPPQ